MSCFFNSHASVSKISSVKKKIADYSADEWLDKPLYNQFQQFLTVSKKEAAHELSLVNLERMYLYMTKLNGLMASYQNILNTQESKSPQAIDDFKRDTNALLRWCEPKPFSWEKFMHRLGSICLWASIKALGGACLSAALGLAMGYLGGIVLGIVCIATCILGGIILPMILPYMFQMAEDLWSKNIMLIMANTFALPVSIVFAGFGALIWGIEGAVYGNNLASDALNDDVVAEVKSLTSEMLAHERLTIDEVELLPIAPHQAMLAT